MRVDAFAEKEPVCCSYLVDQTIYRYGEIDHGDLSRRLRREMRILEPGGDVHPEVLGVFDGRLTQLDANRTPLLKSLLLKQRLQRRVQKLANIFQEDRGAELQTTQQINGLSTNMKNKRCNLATRK